MLNHLKFQIEYGSIEREYQVRRDKYLILFELREGFSANISEPVPTTPVELLAKFLGYIASLVNPNQPDGKYNSILRYVLAEFQLTYLSKVDINMLAFSVQRDYPNVNLREVQINLLLNYYLALANTNSKLAYANSLPDNVASECKYAVCFGQGNINYFDILSQTRKAFGAFNYTDLLVPLCEQLKLAAGNEEFSCLYPHGLDFLSWIDKTEETPDNDYLLSAPVSCPLIAVAQLTNFCSMCKITEMTPGEYNRFVLAGATGHGQGILTSLVISLSDSWESFFQNASKAVHLMLSVGARTGLKLESLGTGNNWLDTDEGRITPMMMISGLPLHEVEDLVTQANNDILKDRHVAISVINGPESLFVSGTPESMHALVLNLRSHEVHNHLEQLSLEGLDQIFEAVSISTLPTSIVYPKIPYKKGRKAFYRFLNICAPFHCHILKDTCELIVQDLNNLGVEFSSKDLKIPVYDTNDGANLQGYDIYPQEYPLTSRVVKLITELPVNWEMATKFTSADVLKIGPLDVFGLFE